MTADIHSPARSTSSGATGAAQSPQSPGAKIGPNALIQTVRALHERFDEARVAELLRHYDRAHLLAEPLTDMVDEQAFAELVAVLAQELGADEAQQVLRRSGQLTAGYLLQHRIPRPFQWLLRPLPHQLALRLLLAAIHQHAWTFVGSGQFEYRVGETTHLRIVTHIDPAEAVCGFYGGTFEQLIRVLVDSRARIKTTTSSSDGQSHCMYAIQRR